MILIAEKLGKMKSAQLKLFAKELNVDINDKAFEGLKEWRLVLSLLLEWEKQAESKKKSRQELARILISIHNHAPTSTGDDKLFLNLARKLDFTGIV